MNDLDSLLHSVHLYGQASLVRDVPVRKPCTERRDPRHDIYIYIYDKLGRPFQWVHHANCPKCKGAGSILQNVPNFHYDPLPARKLRDCLLEQEQSPALEPYYRALVLAEPDNDDWRLLYTGFAEALGQEKYARAIRLQVEAGLQVEAAKLPVRKVFIDSITCSFDDWRANAPKLIYWGPRACPCIRWVKDKEGSETKVVDKECKDCRGKGELSGETVFKWSESGMILIYPAQILPSHQPITTVTLLDRPDGATESGFRGGWPTIKTWNLPT